MSSKLQTDLDNLVADKVISKEISQNITAYYQSKTNSSPNRLITIFGVLGSLLIGLGIILILAHNWDQFSRTTKTIWAFIPLIVGQVLAGVAIFKKKGTAWKESTATFLFFAIGVSISLVSQIYNIPGSMSSFLLSWMLLAIPLLYFLKSHTAAMLQLLFCTIYACNVGYFNNDSPWLYLPLLLWVVPYYFQQIKIAPNSPITGLYHWLFPMSIMVSLGAFISGDPHLGFLIYAGLFGLLYNLGKLPFFEHKKLRTNGYAILGSLGTISILLITSFGDIWKDYNLPNFFTQDIAILLSLSLMILGLLVYQFQKNKRRQFQLFQFAFLLFAFIYASSFLIQTTPAILLNLLVFALGLVTTYVGSKTNRFLILNYGLLIITALISCRFFDANISFVIRGLLFVCIGTGFFATNYWMYKKQQKLNIKTHE